MQRDVQCCMLYSQGKVRTKDVLRFEVQTEGPDCSIQAIMQVFQISNSRSCGGTRRPAGSENMTSCLAEGGGGLRRAATDCHLSRSCCCYGRARGCNCQGSKKGNMREKQAICKKIPSELSAAAATQSAQRGPVKRNQSTLWYLLFPADHGRLLQLRE